MIRWAWTITRKLAHWLGTWHERGFAAAWEVVTERIRPTLPKNASDWLRHYRPRPEQLERFRSADWPTGAPSISILVPLHDTRENWRRELLDSIRSQTYSHWQLVLIDDASEDPSHLAWLDEIEASDPRLVVLRLKANLGVAAASNAGLAVATGEYILPVDHDDVLELHSLHRIAGAILSESRPGLLYADEALTAENADDVLALRLRPAFSHDYYCCHPYFVHPVVFRADLLRAIGGWNDRLPASHDVDAVLRSIELCERIAHIPDVLYRWRTHCGSLGHAKKELVSRTTAMLVADHLSRLGTPASVEPHPDSFNVYCVRFSVPAEARVGVIIPTRDGLHLLKACVESLERTVPARLVDAIIVDHASTDPEVLDYLVSLESKHRVSKADGPFNFAKLNNDAAKQLDPNITHILFLNNDVEALEPGWLESMLGLACRSDVGAVGAMLIYPDDRIQHAGIAFGLLGGADHLFRGRAFSCRYGQRNAGDNCEWLATRDVSAATAACLLVKRELFDRLGGFDECFAVGFNDVDICCRIRSAGFKVLVDGNAVLLHRESQSRGTSDNHPADTERFRAQYAEVIARGDDFSSPLLDPSPRGDTPIPRLKCPDEVTPRTVVLR